MDCCYNATINGDENFCTTTNPCKVDEGDCDNHLECEGDLNCFLTGECPSNLGFNSDVSCCSSGTFCDNPAMMGDGYCWDATNTEECQWDGGDCCGGNVDYCVDCTCLDPNA